jgi:UDP-glucuronate 4-epimerase
MSIPSTYLVTGAAGFIASRVCEMLLGAGHTVIGVDNLNDAYDVRIKHYRLNRLKVWPGFHFSHLDITQKTDLADLEEQRFAAVVNLAARAGVRQSVEDPWIYVDTNMSGTLNLLEFCRQHKIPKFILASTSSIYGAEAPLPTPESADSDHPLQAYAASKKAAEVLCHAYHSLYGLDVTIFRYFTVYGPAGRPDMSMFRFVQWISEGRPVLLNGDGEQSRGFTYVDDIARGTIAGLMELGYEVINLGGHESIKMNDLIHMIEGLVGKNAQVIHRPAHQADMLANWADTEKARRMLGWEPQVPLAEGVANLVAWYMKERAWAKEIVTEE